MDFVNESKVEIIDCMGSDARIVAAARVSYDQETKGEEADKKLLRYLIKHGHWSPFEQPHVTFKIEAPVFVWRQIMRHRMANYNEVSARYTVVKEEFFCPAEWRMQDDKNKQSSQGLVSNQEILNIIYKEAVEKAWESYQGLLWWGVAREQARMVLPVSMMSKVMMTADLRSLLNIFKQRIHEGAQQETRDVAEKMLALVEERFPWTFEIFREEGLIGGN